MTPTHKKILSIFEDDINPFLEMHEGSAVVKGVEESATATTVNIEYKGSCVGCPSAQEATLSSIQNFLREELGNNKILVVASDD